MKDIVSGCLKSLPSNAGATFVTLRHRWEIGARTTTEGAAWTSWRRFRSGRFVCRNVKSAFFEEEILWPIVNVCSALPF